MTPRLREFWVLLLLSAALAACGEKIAIPEAVGIPVVSDYVEQQSWSLTDPVDVIESNGRILVLEQGPGTLTKYSTSQKPLLVVDGLISPTAMFVDRPLRRIVVAEDDGNGNVALSIFDLNDLNPLGRVDLAGRVSSATGVAANGELVFVSDPDSGVVHRLRWTDAASGWLVDEGLVCTDQGSRESPQFIFEPAGLGLDDQGFLLICDADTTRNWVVRFDPVAPEGDSLATGRAVEFRSLACPTPPVQSFVLGSAPGCGEVFEPGTSSGLGGLAAPLGLTLDSEGRIYVADSINGRVQRFETDGSFDLVLGDGAGGVPGLEAPTRVASWLGITSRGGIPVVIPGARIYVVDRSTREIRIFEDRRWTEFQDDA